MDIKAGPKQELVQPIFLWIRVLNRGEYMTTVQWFLLGTWLLLKLSGVLMQPNVAQNRMDPTSQTLIVSGPWHNFDVSNVGNLKDLRLESTRWMPMKMRATNNKKKHPAQVHDPGFMKAGPHDSWIQQRKNHESLCIPCELCTLNLSPSQDVGGLGCKSNLKSCRSHAKTFYFCPDNIYGRRTINKNFRWCRESGSTRIPYKFCWPKTSGFCSKKSMDKYDQTHLVDEKLTQIFLFFLDLSMRETVNIQNKLRKRGSKSFGASWQSFPGRVWRVKRPRSNMQWTVFPSVWLRQESVLYEKMW